MAVEARHLSLFPPQLVGNRELMSAIEGNANVYRTPIGFGVLPPLLGTTADTVLPVYGSVITDSFPAKTAMKADSGLTYDVPVSRKRSRDEISTLLSFSNGQTQNFNRFGSFSFLGEDVSLQIQQQEVEIDRLIAQHTEKLRLEMEDRRNRYSSRIIAAVEEGIMKRLRAKEEEIEQIVKLNWALEERVKSLCIDNQIWRELAQTNEATAAALRSNLEQVLAQVQDEKRHRGAVLDEAAALMGDAQSCCGSNYDGGVDKETRTLDSSGGETVVVKSNNTNGKNNRSKRWCRNCGKVESSLLLLPCMHLCLCTVCGPSADICPVCKSPKNGSIGVNMLSS